MIEINKIYNEDNIITLDRMDDNIIDLTVTSPPYNLDLGNTKENNFKYDSYNDNIEYDEYLKWLETIFAKIYQKTKSGCRCVINIGELKNGRIPTHFYIMQFMFKIGWILHSSIIWNKQSTSKRTAWGSFCSPSSPSFPSSIEYILVFAKDSLKLQDTGETDLTKEEFIKYSNGVWDFPGEKRSKIHHPAPFPVELPYRCIKMFTWVGGLVYDPFIGSGTTAVSCIKTDRNYIGSEISENYIKIANKRIFDANFNKKSLF